MIWAVGLLCKLIRIYYKIIYENVIKKIVNITLRLKESIILFKGNKI